MSHKGTEQFNEAKAEMEEETTADRIKRRITNGGPLEGELFPEDYQDEFGELT